MNCNQSLRQELLDMRERDQKMCSTIMERYGYNSPFSPEDAAWCETVDAANTARMKESIAEYGWPSQTVVGERRTVWVQVRHRQFERAEEPKGRACLAHMVSRVRVGKVVR